MDLFRAVSCDTNSNAAGDYIESTFTFHRTLASFVTSLMISLACFWTCQDFVSLVGVGGCSLTLLPPRIRSLFINSCLHKTRIRNGLNLTLSSSRVTSWDIPRARLNWTHRPEANFAEFTSEIDWVWWKRDKKDVCSNDDDTFCMLLESPVVTRHVTHSAQDLGRFLG